MEKELRKKNKKELTKSKYTIECECEVKFQHLRTGAYVEGAGVAGGVAGGGAGVAVAGAVAAA